MFTTKEASGWVQLELKNPAGLTRMMLNVNQEGEAFAMLLDKSNNGSYATTFRPPSISFVGSDGSIVASVDGEVLKRVISHCSQ